MFSVRDLHPRLTRVIRPLRWIIPVVLGALGFGYTFWESILWDGYPVTSAQVLLGFGLLGIAGPVLTFVTLTWAERAAASYERAENERIHEYRQLLALSTVNQSVSQSLDLDTVLNRALDNVLQVMHLQSGEVRLLENNRLVLRTSRGVSSAFVEAERIIPLGQCICGKSAQRGELIAVEDIGRTPEYGQSACACEKFRAVLSVPVRTTDRVVGVMHVASSEPRVFSPNDRALLLAIGQQVGVAIEKARLHEQLKTLNQELEGRVAQRTRDLLVAKEELARKADALRQVLTEERRVEERTRAHIAHDLHDGIQQIIIGALFETQAARDAIGLNPHTVVARLEAAQALLRRIESEMRDAIYSLRPVALDAQGLAPALKECVASFERASQVQCDLQIEETPRRINPDAEVAAFRIVQEALNNVDAHAQARHAHVRVRFGARDLSVEIADDGCGFEMGRVTTQAHTHLGLIGMQERAESIGGKLEVSSRLGEGTCVRLSVPVAARLS